MSTPSPAITPAVAFRRVALIGRHGSPGIAEPLSALAAYLTARGHSVVLDADTARFMPVHGYPTAARDALGRRITRAAWASSPTSRSRTPRPRWPRSSPAATSRSGARCSRCR
jgi:hypothetical protein